MSSRPSKALYLVRTTVGQEVNVMFIAEDRARREGLPLRSLMCVDLLKGYVIAEADAPHHVEKAFAGIKHVRGFSMRKVDLLELNNLVVQKPSIEGIDINDIVEIVGGPLKGMKGKVARVDRGRNEVTLELLEVPYALPTTVHADYVKVSEKASKGAS